MTFENESRESELYQAAINDTIDAGKLFRKRLSNVPESQASALTELTTAAVRFSEAGSDFHGLEDAAERAFLQAAAEMQAGYLLIEASRAMQAGDSADLREALATFKVEQTDISSRTVSVLLFDKDLTDKPPQSTSPEEALKVFQRRAKRTVDNMISEADEVIQDTVQKLKDKFGKEFGEFAKDIGGLGASLSANATNAVPREAVEKIVSGLKKLGEFLHSDNRKEAIGLIQDSFKLDLRAVLYKSLSCDETKRLIEDVKLKPSMSLDRLNDANGRLVELCLDYVKLLKYARWILKAVVASAALLILTGVFAHYAALGVPIAYAIATVATVIIAIDYARVKMRDLVQIL